MPQPMNDDRRTFIKKSALVTVGALGPLVIPRAVHAGGSETLRVGVVGAGGRGTGAVVDALGADPNTELISIGDTFADRAAACRDNLLNQEDEHLRARVRVDDDHLFDGFDAYKRVVDSDVDVVLLATPPHFRPDHLEYAIQRGKHCFVEKPVAVDAPGIRRVRKTCAEAKHKNLAVVSGLCWRYHPGVIETIKRIRDGAIGDIVSIDSRYNSGTLWHRGHDPAWSQMEYQVRNWLYYTWLSGDHIVEQAIHSLDKTAWLQGDISPLRTTGLGGRQQRTDADYGHIFDHHCVFYEYDNGVRVFFTCRQQDDCSNQVDEFVMGTKGTAQVLKHTITTHDGKIWKYEDPCPSMYSLEQQAMFKSIRDGEPINNGEYMCNSSMIAIMGRMCTYTGKTLSWDQCIASDQRLGPNQYEWCDVPEPEVAIPGITPFG